MAQQHVQTIEQPDRAVLELLTERLKRRLGAAGVAATSIGEDTELLEAGVIDSQGLLDLILEVEEGSGRVFDATRVDFDSGVTLGKLGGAFVGDGAPFPAPSAESSAPPARDAVPEAQVLPAEDVSGRETPVIRPMAPDDVETLCRFLEGGFAGSGVTAAAWRRLFDSQWDGAERGRGYVLAADGEIVGFLGTVHARRRAGGKAGLVCHFSSWYVRPEYRGWGMALLAAAVRDPDMTYTAFSPAPLARRAFTALRFDALDARSLVMPPLLHAGTLRALAPQILFEPGEVRRALDGEQQRVFDDHAPYDCLQLVVRDGPEDYAYLVVKRRVRRPPRRLGRLIPASVPYSEILHCSAPELFARHLERVKLAVLRRQRTVALVADARLLGPVRPRGVPVPEYAYYRSPLFDAGDIDKLYSELVLLPI